MIRLTTDHLQPGKYILFGYKDWYGLMTINNDREATAVDICKTMSDLLEKERDVGFVTDTISPNDHYIYTFDSLDDFRNMESTHPEFLI